MSSRNVNNFNRLKSQRKTVANLSNLPSILNNNFQRNTNKRVSFINRKEDHPTKFETKTDDLIALNLINPKSRQSATLLKCNIFNFMNTPKSRMPSSKFLLNKKIATLEKNIEDMGHKPKDTETKNKRIQLNDLILPKTESKRLTFSLEQTRHETDYMTTEEFVIPIKKENENKIRYSNLKPKAKVDMSKTEYKPSNSLFFKNKKLVYIKKLVNKEFGNYLGKCNELKDYLQTRYKTMETFTYDD
jgi:hypothetical protein